MQRGRLHVIGVRHHSPACAKLVAHSIRRLKPAVVLIEGPADMNGRLDELLLPHTLPVAVFSFARGDSGEAREHASFSPLCLTSPEWQALTVGHGVGADVRFMDLPAWDKAFAGVVNRYSDGARRHTAAVEQLCARFHIDGYDALWDHLFEGDVDDDAGFSSLCERLDAYFVALRHDEAAGERDEPREAMMRHFIEAALANTGPDDVVLAVCGGYHAPAIVMDPETSKPRRWPTIEQPDGAESYLVPWSFKRLDAFAGYAAGMPSPGFYDDVFRHGAGKAIESGLWSIVGALRARGLSVSAADVIAAQTMAEGLGRLRGHPVLRRTDLLDGVAAALVKEPLDEPLPWNARGTLRKDTDAVLVHVLKVLSGTQVGRLADGTPQPPLVKDVEDALRAQRLQPVPDAPARTEKLRLAVASDLDKSRTLHRLRVLQIPGFTRTRGPKPGEDAGLVDEHWVIADHADRLAALIEAAAYGATLSGAVSARLESVLIAADLDLAGLADVLGDAVLVGLDALTTRALQGVRRHAGNETDLVRLGTALAKLLGLFQHDALFGARHRPELRTAVDEVYGRGLWLLEQVTGASSSNDGRLVQAIASLRDTARTTAAGVDRAAFVDVCTRSIDNDEVPPAVRGACLGALWSLGAFESGSGSFLQRGKAGEGGTDSGAVASAPASNAVVVSTPPSQPPPAGGRSRTSLVAGGNEDDDGAGIAVAAVRRMAQPTTIGDYLAGLFALAREEVVHGDAVIAVINEVTAAMPEHDFLIALPALRLAFSFFPPREKVAVADRVAGLHGKTSGHALLKLDVEATTTASGRVVDEAVQELLVRYGLLAATTTTETP